MGTNFYWHSQEPCPTCKRPVAGKHIGKSSAGWCFSLHVYPDEEIHDLADWQKLWRQDGSYIENEYGERVPASQMQSTVIDRQWKGRDGQNATWYASNQATAGPKGLARHALMPGHCIGHGQGTWDLMVGEFS